jgi:hypothetical protein
VLNVDSSFEIENKGKKKGKVIPVLNELSTMP